MHTRIIVEYTFFALRHIRPMGEQQYEPATGRVQSTQFFRMHTFLVDVRLYFMDIYAFYTTDVWCPLIYVLITCSVY